MWKKGKKGEKRGKKDTIQKGYLREMVPTIAILWYKSKTTISG